MATRNCNCRGEICAHNEPGDSDGDDPREQAWQDYFAREDSTRERYWRELKDIENEGRMAADEAAYEAERAYFARPLGARVADALVAAAAQAADCIGRALVLPVAEDDIPF